MTRPNDCTEHHIGESTRSDRLLGALEIEDPLLRALSIFNMRLGIITKMDDLFTTVPSEHWSPNLTTMFILGRQEDDILCYSGGALEAYSELIGIKRATGWVDRMLTDHLELDTNQCMYAYMREQLGDHEECQKLDRRINDLRARLSTLDAYESTTKKLSDFNEK